MFLAIWINVHIRVYVCVYVCVHVSAHVGCVCVVRLYVGMININGSASGCHEKAKQG